MATRRVEQAERTKVSPARRAPTGVTYGRPDLRPTWCTCAAIVMWRRPANVIVAGLSTLVSGRITTRTSRDGLTTGVWRMSDALIVALPSLPVSPVRTAPSREK